MWTAILVTLTFYVHASSKELQTLLLSANLEPGNEKVDTEGCCMCFASWHTNVIERGGVEWIFFKCVWLMVP